MASLFEYLKEHQNDDFSDFALNDVDRVCINELGYLPFGEIASWSKGHKASLNSFYQACRHQMEEDFLVSADRLALLDVMAQSKRFKEIGIQYYESHITREFERQFAAVTFTLSQTAGHQIVFRGTDDTLVGWKEDFKLSYVREIPSHRSAISYLEEYLPHLDGEICLTGHSKGGNLALYAASHLQEDLQAKISQILWFDAPGLEEGLLETSGYLAIKDKTRGYLPQDSIVGIMLWHDGDYQWVKSKSFGINQHNIVLWQVTLEGAFIKADKQTEVSRSLELTFKDWMHEFSGQELKLVFDLVFDTFIDNGFESLNDFTLDANKKLLSTISQMQELDKKHKQLLTRAAKSLLKHFASHLLMNNKETS
ncbi:Mbeg1-like protein [Streptococcus sp. zg-JUN1979]|uniref:Mbeg1-like protein n=1 Tax=Streptococcus sp. zg-JUN1979 TaxID=3391450 RepID=UPI0039A768D4